ncbi:MAG: glutamine--tRNA ligase/YqeY domain fusion protein [Verrucomicrobia bacterium]|nr:glutamine--tRNA ligase/YqeY domain fusion protein [Verrucomicrobiota bacterium]MBU4292385.1 glutamine--tRNA ligase/YqeY domain fusion protein [Verrucomicrobiota bacterium]MBU4428212.1 glutamine--tRNA ligase/YqeY domain fusion protein [Verrucomicrobiota bacterium]MBU4496703.1 glutamine--tRNA ligase/YqeY domain fusion protein [Verrucomicrobiota bacterium]MCG2679111.1 glutamine--tRNA ligase/YqeY domain fusion protein [Kiritimatiellia bacterium]
MNTPEPASTGHFIRRIIEDDLKTGKTGGRVVTRFPPEPNGPPHIGHAKSIGMNFGLAAEFGGVCHLRFDDTNPSTEDVEYVDAFQRDIRWLGFDWGQNLFYASDYYERLYTYAVELIKKGKAYVCELNTGEFKEYRGVPTRPGKESPGRTRLVEENLDIFARMRAGEFDEGRYVLRARIDMASPNLHLRDPVIYRIKKEVHHRTGAVWCIYPMYDFAHCLSDSIEKITHSICTLEFEVHRPLYDWILDALEVYHPRQIEFARLNLSYTIMSKRKLQQLVEGKQVAGWDDPRLPTLAGLRRRGYTPAAIRDFCERIGITKFNSLTDVALLEHCIRDELNKTASRVMAVLNPLRVVIDNYPEDQEEFFDAVNNPEDPTMGSRKVPFSRVIYIERDDFREQPPKKFFRLAPGQEVRLRYACYITCTSVVKDDKTGEIVELHCTYDPASRGGASPDGRKVRGTIHWVSARHAVQAEVRLYDRLFLHENPAEAEGNDFLRHLNPNSLQVVTGFLEPGLVSVNPWDRVQFERLGYFCADGVDSKPGQPVFNRIVTLKDSWGKIEKGSAG